jgi:riboflavin kinase / FMN adenylyltransferase
VKIADRVISSTLVRSLLAEGKLAEIEECLGSEWSLEGTVQPGQQLARQWGVPTANLPVEGRQLPPYGVYFVDATLEDDLAELDEGHDGFFYGLANLGLRPTLGQEGAVQPLLEVHFLEPAPDLVGRRLLVNFLHFHRPEQKFASLDDLRAQIHRDVEAANEWWNEKA